MILLTAILFILTEAITEGLIKRHSPAVSAIIFKWWVQWIIVVVLFVIWLIIALQFYYVPIVKLVIGFVFVRFLVFDVVWNIVRGVRWNYYGNTKLYDRIMIRSGSFGWFIKAIAGIMGIVFLMGWS